MQLVNIAKYLKHLYPSLTWERDTAEKLVYLTFDDGPHPEITHWTMDILRQYEFKATFFCIGDNLLKFPQVAQDIEDSGHRIGNHTLHHLSGFGTPTEDYIKNVEDWSMERSSQLFRPPYGRIKRKQINALKEDYEIVMWSILSWDFQRNINREKILRRMKKGVRSGSIIVFHDSEKAEANLKAILPPFCEFLQDEGYRSVVL